MNLTSLNATITMDKLIDYGRQFAIVKQEQFAELDMKHVVATNIQSFLAMDKVKKSRFLGSCLLGFWAVYVSYHLLIQLK
jgi:hypothetical protein